MGNICVQNKKYDQAKYRSSIVQSYSKSPKNLSYEQKQILSLTSQNSQSFHIEATHFNDFKTQKMIQFKIIKVIGKGSFGKVMLIKDNKTQTLYAMKIIDKNNIQNSQAKMITMSERYILESMDNPFIVQLHYAFQNSKKLFLVVDFVQGGDLFSLLRKKVKFTEEIARFFAAEIVLALQYLHSRNIIYRDLKPQNILLDKQLHIKMTDFGLSKICYVKDQLTYTLCGTVQYMAPQVIAGQGYTQSADWYSFGCVLYEMLIGTPPFYNSNRSEMMKNIKNGKITYPNYVSQSAKSLLNGLLQNDIKKRLGYKNGATQIKVHNFFNKIDFISLYKKKIDSPLNFQPVQIEQNKVNFSKQQINECLFGKDLNQQNNFQGFTYLKSDQNSQTLQKQGNFIFNFANSQSSEGI